MRKFFNACLVLATTFALSSSLVSCSDDEPNPDGTAKRITCMEYGYNDYDSGRAYLSYTDNKLSKVMRTNSKEGSYSWSYTWNEDGIKSKYGTHTVANGKIVHMSENEGRKSCNLYYDSAGQLTKVTKRRYNENYYYYTWHFEWSEGRIVKYYKEDNNGDKVKVRTVTFEYSSKTGKGFFSSSLSCDFVLEMVDDVVLLAHPELLGLGHITALPSKMTVVREDEESVSTFNYEVKDGYVTKVTERDSENNVYYTNFTWN